LIVQNGKLRKFVTKTTGIELAEYQLEIVGDILSRRHKHLIIVAATQSGKSYAVALAIADYVHFSIIKKYRLFLSDPLKKF
jgi:superfamily II DNA or RNA helicase